MVVTAGKTKYPFPLTPGDKVKSTRSLRCTLHGRGGPPRHQKPHHTHHPEATLNRHYPD